MTPQTISVVLLAVLAIALLMIASAMINRRRVLRRLQLATGDVRESRVQSRIAEGMTGVRSGVERTLGVLGTFLPLGQKDQEKISVGLQRAGFRSANAVTVAIGTKVACLLVGLAGGGLGVSTLFSGVIGWGAGLLGGLLLGVACNLVPEWIITRLAARRVWRIQTALTDAIDLLIVCLEAGLTFERALRRTVSDLRAFRPELADELGQASLDMRIHGMNREEALGRVAQRLDLQSLKDLTTTVAQSERQGTPAADALRRLSSSVRVEMVASMQAKMARLPTLLIIPSMVFMLPGLLVIVGGPAFVQLIEGLSSAGGL
ncbi:MAG: type II secretion system F family protein [Gammaproteobacteria bacterium]|nr:type II secretion system F family protein [Gammaproteobacteria bacterium]